MKHVALVGFGAIGRSIADEFGGIGVEGLTLAAVCLRETQMDEAAALLGPDVLVTSSLEAILDLQPDIVIEAAGQQFIVDHAARILEQGCELHILSVGALADDALRGQLEDVALRSGGSIVIPAGALGGFDALLSLRAGGLEDVCYMSIKPPHAWRGTPAEEQFDIEGLQERTTILDATAREAALHFPRNANLAAAVAIAGLGLERTRVQLIADPSVEHNIGRLVAHGAMGQLDLTLSGGGFGANPKTSRITGYSVVAGLRNEAAAIRFL